MRSIKVKYFKSNNIILYILIKVKVVVTNYGFKLKVKTMVGDYGFYYF